MATASAAAAQPAITLAAKSPIATSAETQADVAFTLPQDSNASGPGKQDGQQPSDTSGADAQTSSQTTLPGAPALAAVNVSPPAAALASAHGADITAQLAAQITSKASAARTAFDFALEPQGLGRVDVSLKIDSQGQLSAVFSFDNPNAAAEAKSRSGDLQQALQQAGFDVGQSGLSFTSSGGQGHGAAWPNPAQNSYAQGPVAADTAAASPLVASNSALGASRAGGLDITI